MHRLCLLLILVLPACRKSKEAQCDELAKLGIAVADQLGKSLSNGKSSDLGSDPEIRAKMAEFKQQCMSWPQEVFDCMRDNDETSPKCKEAMTHVTGLVSTDIAKTPPGPPVVASATLGEVRWEGLAATLTADGLLIAAPKEAIVAVDATGKERWRTAVEHGAWLLVDNGLVIARDKTDLVALDVATGTPKWRIEVPRHADEGISDRTTEGAVRVGGRVYVPTADGRFLKLDPTACATPKQKGCLVQAFALDNETISDPKLAAIGDDILMGESNAIRRISTTGAVLGRVHVRDDFGGFTVGPGERVAAVMDDELVLWNFAQCTGPSAIVLRRLAGRMYMKGDGECEGDCIAPPTGCLLARSELKDVDSNAPAVLHDGSIVISNFDGPARAAINGNKQWATEIDSVGPVREAGDEVVFVSRGDDDKPARVVALETATGKAKWSTALTGISSKFNSSTDVTIEVNGPWIVAGAKGAVAWIKRP